MKKIIITRKLLKESEGKASNTFDVKFNNNDELYSQSKLIELCEGYDAILTSLTDKMDEETIKKLPNSLAILAINQLHKIDVLNQKRLTNAEIWSDWALSNNLSTPYITPNTFPAYLRFPILIDEDNENKIIQSFEGQLNIGDWMDSFLTGASSTKQPDPATLPNAKYAINNIINLPCLKVSSLLASITKILKV